MRTTKQLDREIVESMTSANPQKVLMQIREVLIDLRTQSLMQTRLLEELNKNDKN